MLTVKRNSRKDRRKRVAITVKPRFTHLPKKQQRYTHAGKEIRRSLDNDEGTSSRDEVTGSKMGSLEERREVHRVHERQRHRSLNEAMKELVKILPPGDSYKSVTKYNVLRTANDYIDFLQHKITHLCLERSIEQKIHDGRISFNIPLNTVVGGKHLKIPAATPVSPKILQSVHKAAKDLSTDLLARRGPLECNGRTPPRRFCRSRLTKTSPKATLKASSVATLSPDSGAVHGQGIQKMASDKPSLPPETLMASPTSTESDQGELVVDEDPSDQPDRPIGPTPTDPDQGDLVVEEAPLLQGSDPSAVFAGRPEKLSETTRAVCNYSEENVHSEKNSWPRKAGSGLSSASIDGKEQVRLLDHYIHADASPHREYAHLSGTPKPVEELPLSISASSAIPLGTAPIQSCRLPYHAEHSYSAKFLPADTASSGVADDNKSPTFPVAVAFPSSLQSSQTSQSAASGLETMTASESRVGGSTDVIPCILSSSLYIQQAVSFPFKMVSCESASIPNMLAHRASSGATQPIPTTVVTPTASKRTTHYVPIQPATSTSNIDAVATLLNLYGQSSVVQNKQPTVTDASAQKLVVDPNFLKFEDLDSPTEITSDSDHQQLAVMTPAAGSGCSMRRSWINGFQLFTKVNHPRFRDKWARLQGREITRLLSQTWKELPTDFKKLYSCKARQWNQWHRSKRESANHATSVEL